MRRADSTFWRAGRSYFVKTRQFAFYGRLLGTPTGLGLSFNEYDDETGLLRENGVTHITAGMVRKARRLPS